MFFKLQCKNCGAIQEDSTTPNQCQICTINASFFQTIVESDYEIEEKDNISKVQCRNCAELIEAHNQVCPFCCYENKASTLKNDPKKKPNSFILLN